MSKEHVSRLMKDKNSKFLSKYSSRKSLRVCSYMLPFFSDKFKIHYTHQWEIKIYYWKQTINEIVQPAIQ